MPDAGALVDPSAADARPALPAQSEQRRCTAERRRRRDARRHERRATGDEKCATRRSALLGGVVAHVPITNGADITNITNGVRFLEKG
jgi:hypothetical protein